MGTERTKGAHDGRRTPLPAAKDAVVGKSIFDVKPGTRIYVEDPHATQGGLSSLVALVTMFLFVDWIAILTVLFLYAVVARSIVVGTLVAVIWSSVFWPTKTLWMPFLNSPVFKTWRQYTSFSAVCDSKLERDGNYVFAAYPHGVIPFSPIVASTCVESLFPKMNVFAISASMMFRIPGYRHFMSFLGAQPATAKNFKRLLKKGSCAVIVGGLAEMYMQETHRERILLKSRRGFIKVALESGADLVPVYHFGNSLLIDIIGKPLQAISRKIGMSIMRQYGRFGLAIPRRHPVMMCTGTPIKVTQMSKDEDPEKFAAEVERLHGLYVEAIGNLYNKYRGMFGWENRPLEIE